MAVTSPERVFYVGNHPKTGEMYFPLFKFLVSHPNTALVAGKIWAMLPRIDVIPVEVAKFYQGTEFKHKIERAILSLFGDKVERVNVVQAMTQRIREGKNVMIFPAGKPAEGTEQPWKPGVAKALLETRDEHPSVAFVHIHDGKMEITEPRPAQDFLRSEDPNEVIQLLKTEFDSVFNMTSKRT